ncbi:MAG: ABC transporter substrate-binding protein [Microbacteriaceae bacterium]|jgi:ABC-type nitrate/sulfonate/bicarbonate transport system substrate-binding protein|nr:ABC transporter substrate-binding protein [Microbacteriaceae bacterium]MCI1207324.1 ABC transporter substrate-binding protein [Microbacteriaceae bacterium]
MSITRVRLEYVHPWSNHAGLYLARADGLYADRGMDVEFTAGDSFRGDPATLLDRGECDIAFMRLIDLVRHQHGSEHRLVSVGVLNQRQIGGVVTRRSTGITRLRELEGHRVCIPLGTKRLLTELREAVETDGGDFTKVEIVPPGTWEPDMRDVEKGRFDAFVSVAAWEPYVGSTPPAEVVILDLDAVSKARHHSFFLAVRRETLERTPQAVRAFLEATDAGYHAAASDPDRAVEALQPAAANYDPETLRTSLTVLAPTWFDAAGRWGAADSAKVSGYLEWLISRGHLGVDPEEAREAVAAGCVTNEYLPR